MDSIEKIKEIANFSSDREVFVLYAMVRKKFNAPTTKSTEIILREIVRNEDEVERRYNKLIRKIGEHPGFNWYIYLCVNGRDVIRADVEFESRMNKYRAEVLMGGGNFNSFKRTDKTWFKSLMSPASRGKDKRFMFDIDTDDINVVRSIEFNLSNFGVNYKTYPSRTGYHLLSQPFNRKLLDEKMGDDKKFYEVKTDGLVFIEAIGDFE